MYTSGVAGLILMSVVAGLGTYCGACALHVWTVRNRGASEGLGRSGSFAQKVRSVSAVVLMIGLGVMGVVAAITRLTDYEGILQGDRLYAVRIPESFHVRMVTGDKSVEKGHVLARFWSPEREAELAVLGLSGERLQVERQIVESLPVIPSAEITRDLQEASAEHRHVEFTINELTMEHARLAREATRDRTTKHDEINRSQEALDKLQSELEQAQARLTLSRDRLDRSRKLYEAKSVSIDEHAQHVSEAAIHSAEVARIDTQIANVVRQKAKLEQALHELAAIAARQSESFADELSERKDLLESLDTQMKDLNVQLADDLAQAEVRRRKELKQLDVQLRQTERKLAGLSAMQRVTAPFAGLVAFCAASPDTVFGDAPLLVLAPTNGFRLKARVRKCAVLPLQKVGTIRSELVEDRRKDDAVDFGFVERRFAGRLVHWKPLPDDPFYVLAELACDPPPEAVRAMASGWEVRARLVWAPPLFSIPEFQVGAMLAGAAWIVWLSARLWTTRRTVTSPRGELPIAPRPSEAVLVEYGAEGAMLHLLGSQLREAIHRGHLEASLIAAVEWSLDRHRSRAVRLVSAGLGDAEDAADYLESYVKEVTSTPSHSDADNLRIQRETLERLFGVLRVIGAAPLRTRVARLQRLVRTVDAASEPSNVGSASNGHERVLSINAGGGGVSR